MFHSVSPETTSSQSKYHKKLHHLTSKFPCCSILMKTTDVNGYKLRFSERFSKQIPYDMNGTFIFEGEYGKKWPVKYFCSCTESIRIVVSAGWIHFVKDNYLKIGDTCFFELLPRRSIITLKVTIIRRLDDNDSDVHRETTSPPHSNGRAEKMVGKRKLFKPKTSRFFKIVHKESVERGRLLIPKKFAKKHKNELPNQILLKVPSGAVWKVELVEIGDELWLLEGWREFQTYYAIAHGTFLVFEYRGGNSFEVVIFDLTTSEIDYPYDDDDDDDDDEERMVWQEHEEANKKRKRDDYPGVDESLPSSKKKAKSPFPCPHPPKMERTTFSSNPQNAGRRNASVSSHKHGENRINKNKEVFGGTTTVKTEQTDVVYSQNNSMGFKEAAGSKSENMSFAIVMSSTYLGGQYLRIPTSFSRIHLTRAIGDLILQNSEGETWIVTYKTYGSYRVVHLRLGWSEFIVANKLQLGDECIFELINPAECRLKVVIVRASNEKFLALPAPNDKCLGDKRRKVIKQKSSAPEWQICVPPVAAQSIAIKTENFT